MEETKFSLDISNNSNTIEISDSLIKTENLSNFNVRKNVIEQIISDIISKEKFTISINLNNINVEEKKLERLIIELIPRLKEIGANIVLKSNNILSDIFLEQNGL